MAPRKSTQPEPRPLPADIEAEQAVLAACFINPKIIPQVQGVLSGPDFNRSAHETIFRGICELKNNLDPVTFGDWARTSGVFDRIGGAAYIIQLTEIVSISGGWKRHAEIVKGLAQRRKLILACYETAEKAFSISEDFDQILSDHKTAIRETQASKTIELTSSTELANQAYAIIDQRSKGQAKIGIPTGFANIDSQVQGLEPACTYYLGAPSHTGKSALALNIADNVANSGSVLYFILESTGVAQTFRRLANRTGISLTRLRMGNLYGDPEWELVTKACGDISDSRLWVIDNPQYARFENMQSICETWSMEQNLSLVVVDYLQLMSIAGTWQSEHVKFKNLTIQFNHLAKTIQCPFLILSQLNTEGQLKESRDIYSNADHVWRLERQGDGSAVKIIFEKGRDTGTSVKWLDFDPHKMRFKDFSGEPLEHKGRKDIDL